MRVTRHLIVYLVFSLLWNASNSFATSTTVMGNAYPYRGQVLEVHRYLDLFTFKSTPLATVKLPEDGSFKLEVEINATGMYLVKAGKIHAHVFLIPGDVYTIVLPEPPTDVPFNAPHDVFVQPEVFESGTRLNQQITDLEQKINTFVIENATRWALKDARVIVDSFLVQLNTEYRQFDSPFFRDYFFYRKGELELCTNFSRPKVYGLYFETAAPRHELLSYANAFKLFYRDYLHPKSVHEFSDSLDTYMQKNQFTRALNLIKKDPYLERPDYLHLCFATELHTLGRERKYPLKTVLTMLDSLEQIAKDAGTIVIIQNSRVMLKHLAPGSVAPDFVFLDVVGNPQSLADYRGKYVYVQFFGKLTPETLRQMSLMKVLKEGYGTDIAMFSLSTTEAPRRLRDMATKQGFDWFFGYLPETESVIRDYDLRTFPMYYLIDADQLLMLSPAPPPGERIERRFAEIWSRANPNKNLLFKLQPPEVSEEPPPPIVPPK